MFSFRMLLYSAAATLLFSTAASAACTASGGEQRKITNLAQMPEKMKTRRIPSGVANSFKSAGRTTAAPPWSWLELDLTCGDWIVICSDPDCNHGVVDCAGTCIPF